ncbi:MAG: hypothetical protein HQL38_11300 [Alphaproteobacteria bacterium]|nr:hypothetical protein [Alphaproteobacteria bacterium]
MRALALLAVLLVAAPAAALDPREQTEREMARELQSWQQRIARLELRAMGSDDPANVSEVQDLRDEWRRLKAEWVQLKRSRTPDWEREAADYRLALDRLRDRWRETAQAQ